MTVPVPVVSDMPHSSADPDAQGVEELEHLARRRRRADVHGDRLVEPEHGAQHGKDAWHRPALRGRPVRRAPARPSCSRRTFSSEAANAASTPSTLLVGQPGQPRLEAGLHLLPDPRHGEEPVRPHRRQVRQELLRIRAGGDREAEDQRQVVVRGALGDVRRRQPRDHPAAVRNGDYRRSTRAVAMMLRCTSCTPFGGPVVPDV